MQASNLYSLPKAFLVAILLASSSIACVAQHSGRSFYVDCTASAKGDGSIKSPWSSLASVNAVTFVPGDTIRIHRGTVCNGALSPHGSGDATRPIHLTAYGEGPRPRIVAPHTAEEAFHLFNQEYWDLDSIDFAGGNTYGIFITGDKGIMHHIRLNNLAVHDVFGGPVKHKESGLVSISPSSANEHFDDVIVDGVTAWNTNQWVGILVGGGNVGYPPETDWSSNAVIRNSTIHDVQGDGIVLFRVRKGIIDSTVAWNTGMQETESMGTPNAIWTWMCNDCVVKNSEAYLTDSPGVDGGAFDIDYGNTKNSVVDNYGHDTQGYCVAVFGAGFVTRESVVRGNLCINNGRSPRMAKYQGAIFLLSWNGGSIDGLTIENNTVYFSPFEGSPALINYGTIKPGTAVFRNNTIYSTSPWMMKGNTNLAFDHDHYIYYGADSSEWSFGEKNFATLQQLQSATSQETGATFEQHSLDSMPQLLEHGSPTASRPGSQSGWNLLCTLPVELDQNGLLTQSTLKQLAILTSAARQYRPQGLHVALKLTSADKHLFDSEAWRNALLDLDLTGIDTITFVSTTPMQTTTFSGTDGPIKQWVGYVGPVALGLALRSALGEPVFAQMEVSHHE